MVLGLFVLGAAWDLWRIHGPAPPVEPVVPPAAAARPGPDPDESSTTDRQPPAPSGPGPSGVPIRIDLNRAGVGELDRLPGIGPVLAGRIVERRRIAGPYRSVEELLAVRGIGPALFERLRDRVHAGPADSVPGEMHDRGSLRP